MNGKIAFNVLDRGNIQTIWRTSQLLHYMFFVVLRGGNVNVYNTIFSSSFKMKLVFSNILQTQQILIELGQCKASSMVNGVPLAI